MTDVETASRTIRILLCDDHQVFAQALTLALDHETDLEVVGIATDSSSVLLHEHTRPDVAVVDVRLGAEDGLELIPLLTRLAPDCGIVVLTAFEDDEALVRAHDLGAKAYLVKSTSCDHLISVIRDVAAGMSFLVSNEIEMFRSRLLQKRSRRLTELSDGDRRLVELVRQGLPDREIAAEMHLSLQTIRNRVSRLLHKFELNNRTQLAMMDTPDER